MRGWATRNTIWLDKEAVLTISLSFTLLALSLLLQFLEQPLVSKMVWWELREGDYNSCQGFHVYVLSRLHRGAPYRPQYEQLMTIYFHSHFFQKYCPSMSNVGRYINGEPNWHVCFEDGSRLLLLSWIPVSVQRFHRKGDAEMEGRLATLWVDGLALTVLSSFSIQSVFSQSCVVDAAFLSEVRG